MTVLLFESINRPRLQKRLSFELLMFCIFAEYLILDNFTAELKLQKPFDREKQKPNPVPLKITCFVRNKTSDFTHRCNHTVQIRIMDVDDNAPYLVKNGERVNHITGLTFAPKDRVRQIHTECQRWRFEFPHWLILVPFTLTVSISIHASVGAREWVWDHL